MSYTWCGFAQAWRCLCSYLCIEDVFQRKRKVPQCSKGDFKETVHYPGLVTLCVPFSVLYLFEDCLMKLGCTCETLPHFHISLLSGGLEGIHIPDGDPAAVQHRRRLHCAAADGQHSDQNGIPSCHTRFVLASCRFCIRQDVAERIECMGVFDLIYVCCMKR